jgi:hypothetical protein
MKFSAKVRQAGNRLWKEARSKFPGDDLAARAWFNEHLVHRVDAMAHNEEADEDADEDALVERVRTICIDAVRMYPDEREAAIQWALDKWERDVGSLGNRDDPEVLDVIRRCLDLAYFGKKG